MISQQAEKFAKKMGRRMRPDDSVNAPVEPAVQLTRFDVLTRAEAVGLDHAGAATSSEFQKLAAAADDARDLRDWAAAEFLYWQALELYPFHSGYRIQYAHVIKEQGKHDWAEVHYRSALAEGAAPDLVDEHLRFSARQNHFNYAPRPTPRLDVAPLDAPASFHDIQMLAWLFWHDANVNSYDTLDLMRECESNREVAIRMTQHDRFTERNRPFLEMLRN